MYFRPSLGIVFLILTGLQVFGLYIFLKGFLLTRQTLDLSGHTYPSWDRFPLHHQNKHDHVPSSIASTPAFKRVIIILIDALRFDFVLNTTHPTNPYYLNQFPVIQHLQDTQPHSSLLFQFRADPPTTTMQRIKGIMTGSLPTFIDAGANFASSAVGEDHLLRHVHNKYSNIYFMGDDTWVNLFPEVFDPQRTFDSDSFKMLDLDSVDNAILSNLWPLMESNTDWEVAIAHFLGVDHCGHTYGPSDPNMKRKLNQMNAVIERLLPQVDNDTLLVLMGDHGMSVEGDHGGESIEELMSTLFMHSGRPLTLSHDSYYKQLYNKIHTARSTRLEYDLNAISDRLSYNATQHPIIAQIHLVPTLSYLLQIPIPFGSLGAIVPDLIYPQDTKNSVQILLHMIEQFRNNALQVHDYLIQYAQKTHQLDFSSEKLGPITQHLYAAEDIMLALFQQSKFMSLLETSTLSSTDHEAYKEQLEEAILEYDAFLISTIKYCEAIWAQFDTGCMFIGIILLGFSTLTSFWMLVKQNTSLSLRSAFAIGVPTLVISITCVYLRYTVFAPLLLSKGWFEKMEQVDWIGVSTVLTVCLISSTIKSKSSNHSYDWCVILVADIVQSFTLGSNSFVIWEDRGTRYALATLSVCWALRNQTNTSPSWIYPLLFSILVRITSLTGQCREEQFPDCTYVHSGLLEFGYDMTGMLTIGFITSLLALLYYFSQLLKKRANNALISSFYLVSALIVTSKIAQEVYLKNAIIDHQDIITRLVQKYMDVYLPRAVYGLCLVGTLLSIINQKQKESMGWSILLLWSTVLAIVQRPFASAIILASPLFIHLLKQGDSSSLLIRLTMLHFLGHHLFFVTGHQATFTSLPWKAAFVGFDEMNYYGGMILVTLSTMAGYIISWFGWFILLVSSQSSTESLHLLTLLQSIPTFLCAICILILRRHLMTWKIFAPRFLLQILLEVGSHLAAIVLEKSV